MWQIFSLVPILDFLNCFMITISWYWPWNNKIRKTIIWSLLMSSLVSETWGVTFLRFFFATTPRLFSSKRQKQIWGTLLFEQNHRNLFLEQQQKQPWESHLKSQRLAAFWFAWAGSLTAALKIISTYPLQFYWYAEIRSITSSPWQQLTMPLKLFCVNKLGTITLVWRPARTVEMLQVNYLLRQECKWGECKLCEFFLFHLHCNRYWLSEAKSLPKFIFISNYASCS